MCPNVIQTPSVTLYFFGNIRSEHAISEVEIRIFSLFSIFEWFIVELDWKKSSICTACRGIVLVDVNGQKGKKIFIFIELRF
jgi:hypothetical protein